MTDRGSSVIAGIAMAAMLSVAFLSSSESVCRSALAAPADSPTRSQQSLSAHVVLKLPRSDSGGFNGSSFSFSTGMV